MLSPADLLQFACDLASRLPNNDAYREERNRCWELICAGWLRLGDLDAALNAFSKMDDPQAAGPKLVEICKWVGARLPSTARGRDFLRNAIAEIARWEEWLYLKDTVDLAPAIFRLSGEEGIKRFAHALKDGFTAASVLVAIAPQVRDASRRLGLLQEAESRALEVHDGNRDYALLRVSEGYADAGAADDAERVVLKMQNPNLGEYLGSVLSSAASALEKAEEVLASSGDSKTQRDPQANDPSRRLSRLVQYRYNDLKIRFLVDMAALGGVPAGEIEIMLAGPDFGRVEPPRQPGIQRDPSSFDDEPFDRFWFDRPIPLDEADEDLLLDGGFGTIVDPDAFLEKVTAMFRRFGSVGRTFSEDQIDQGLWCLFGRRFLGEYLYRTDIRLELRLECVRAMLCPFRNYYAGVEKFAGGSFFMWWDHVMHGGETVETEIEEEIVSVMEQILSLPGEGCADAALHGLNHLHRNPRAIAIVNHYLEANRSTMTAERLDWVTACASGTAL